MKNRRLIQEDLQKEGGSLWPWRMLVACVTLNRTTWKQARPAFEAILRRYPSPGMLVRADEKTLTKMLQPIGLQNVRARTLKLLSREYWRRYEVGELDGPKAVAGIPGVGPYVMASWKIFVDLDLRTKTNDKALRSYLRRRREELGF